MPVNHDDLVRVVEETAQRLRDRQSTDDQSPVEEEERERAIDALIELFRGRLTWLTAAMSEGELDQTAFGMLYEMEIRLMHWAAAAAARGGFAYMQPGDERVVATDVMAQMRQFASFRNSLRPPVTYAAGAARRRASSYAGAIRRTFWRIIERMRGMPPLPFYPADRTRCMNNCRCRWEIVKLDGLGDWDCYWRRFALDSCPTCLAREAACNPLRIRNFVVQPFPSAGTVA